MQGLFVVRLVPSRVHLHQSNRNVERSASRATSWWWPAPPPAPSVRSSPGVSLRPEVTRTGLLRTFVSGARAKSYEDRDPRSPYSTDAAHVSSQPCEGSEASSYAHRTRSNATASRRTKGAQSGFERASPTCDDHRIRASALRHRLAPCPHAHRLHRAPRPPTKRRRLTPPARPPHERRRRLGANPARGPGPWRVLAPAIDRANAELERLEIEPIGKVSPHGLRRTFASLRAACGDDPVYISRQIGHEDVAFTLRTYAHAVKRRERLCGAHRAAFGEALVGHEWAQTAEESPSALTAPSTTEAPIPSEIRASGSRDGEI